jgi:single-stranded DNA-binding protein
MTTFDVNQLTISGRVESQPELEEHPECGTVCRFVLTHTVEPPDAERFECELQFYNVAIYGPLGESFMAAYKPGLRIIINGRLDCEHQETLLGCQPVAWILADSIITLHGTAEQTSDEADQLPRI